MKHIALILPLILLLGMVQAQNSTFGVKAGLNVSNFNGGNFDDAKKEALYGFHGGVFLAINLPGITIQPEALVSTQGAKVDFDGSGPQSTQEYKLTYLNVPVMLKFRAPIGLYGEIGPQFGFKLNEDYDDQTINQFAKNLDLSAAVGVGIQGKSGLGIGARYCFGLSKVGDFDPADLYNADPDFKNGVLQVSLMIGL